ncbi:MULTISPECIES: ABC transporter permease [unclassified Paenibacillus]|uniref:ABC transporter permease n=1 Tax=unclassified Paenibacillus TaxID=185978 RepID=UPI001AEAF32C|nr:MULTISPECIES: ABC transporter permease [unclassified Paenibacillus]MBP1156877.1 ABC-2 type transport system permease protein [Paenibacillus sp. PvP091]MBP1172384.1 ABC-2 type transport system permease protein [Paenibacillus sp. PvR098]MBP2438765.1 ABC-2 type transport system permease protein [Paenibacillus sp. PvP052]
MNKKEPPKSSKDTSRLWNKRTHDFLLEIRPFIGYALQSAALTIVLLMLAGSYFYTRILSEAPAGFPFRELAALVLLPCLALSPIRTYLKEADLIYMVPMEAEMSAYMQKAASRAFWTQSLALLAVWTAAWPMYAVAAEENRTSFIVILLVLAALKKVLLVSRWQELKWTEHRYTLAWSALRWLIAGGLTYLLLLLPLWTGAFVVSTALLLIFGVLHWIDKKSIHWPRLIDTEKKHRAFIFRLLNQFIDVSEVQSRPRPMPAPMKLLRLLGGFRFDSQDTYRYMYTLVWLRSEWFGITLRLTVLGTVLISFSRGILMTSFLFILFTGLLAIQLKELQKAYRHSDWSFIYPLPADLRIQSAHSVRFRIYSACTTVLTIPAFWALPHPLYAPVLFIVGWGVSYLYGKIKRKH